ncbi:MAG: hypothetical protein KGD64_15070 [Candidatus Heimdallarchaeota archaeon]|nr:hypothetical protein [Candidatus Heimdallarchaeota archaeon]
MKNILPPEILSVIQILTDSEQEKILQLDQLNPNSNLEDIENLLKIILQEMKTVSDPFSFLLGRILYHRAKFSEIEIFYNQQKSAGMGLWYALILILLFTILFDL